MKRIIACFPLLFIISCGNSTSQKQSTSCGASLSSSKTQSVCSTGGCPFVTNTTEANQSVSSSSCSDGQCSTSSASVEAQDAGTCTSGGCSGPATPMTARGCATGKSTYDEFVDGHRVSVVDNVRQPIVASGQAPSPIKNRDITTQDHFYFMGWSISPACCGNSTYTPAIRQDEVFKGKAVTIAQLHELNDQIGAEQFQNYLNETAQCIVGRTNNPDGMVGFGGLTQISVVSAPDIAGVLKPSKYQYKGEWISSQEALQVWDEFTSCSLEKYRKYK